MTLPAADGMDAACTRVFGETLNVELDLASLLTGKWMVFHWDIGLLYICRFLSRLKINISLFLFSLTLSSTKAKLSSLAHFALHNIKL